ncbi:cyclic nucleotide-binding domain-containing protein (plasmid) [Kovacikia minuta CCNUW1]|uniref:cyclic nucleotide-binding domain-containing protein n=1 Tax=Kovacikia minuta TaxID=2931930 RepID=UPI001CC90641|nr:cyclic nucleotide-binding domain-containing protein [Kovacikia minuta]UBF30416.1 cyclic nucleotide-binding domain-containing protein [Kovacikia minuta CCNUW1]
MEPFSSIHLPGAFTSYIEANFYGKVTEQSMLETIVNNESFLAEPLKHVALYSDHGIVHGRDIAAKIEQVLHQINGLLISKRQGNRLEFMLGYGVMLAYLHDIGMRDFSAFGRVMHPEFAAQLVYTPEFDPLVDLLWQENSGNVAWRLSNLSMGGKLQQNPQLVLREMLSLSIAHSKSKISVALLNDPLELQKTIQTCLSTNLHTLYHQQQIAKIERKLATESNLDIETLATLKHQLEIAKTSRSQWLKQTEHATHNPDLDRYYQNFAQTSFQWLTSSDPALQSLAVDVIDTLRVLRCADALRQRGQRFRTSAGYEVFVNQHTANAVYGLRSSDGSKQFLLEGKDPIAAGEANITSCVLDREGDLRVSFDRGSFSSPEAIQWAVHSAAIVINDIQADVIGSFQRSVGLDSASFGQKQPDTMKILIEGVDDNPTFAPAVCAELGQLNPVIADRCCPVTSLQHADLVEVERYLAGIQPTWNRQDQQSILNQIGRSGQKVDHLDLPNAFRDIKIVTLKAGEILFEADSPGSFVYISMGEGLRSFPSGGYQAAPVQAWMQIGDTAAIKGSRRNARVIAEQPTHLLMIPKQPYLQYWYNPYTVDEFIQLFGGTHQSTLERRHLLPAIAVYKKFIGKTRRHRYLPLSLRLKTVFQDPEQVAPFITYLEQRDVRVGDCLFRQADPADAIYFLELGQVHTVVEFISGQPKSVQSYESGALIGEIDFYTQSGYQTTAVAQCDSHLYCLTRAALHRMQQAHPQTALAFSNMLLSLVANRLVEVAKP